ncbi:hypothetical protein EV646_109270 [Kribbella antiqua]|uniref:Lipoprotein n=1 Tax=Kribbella antiqua TaxID=2512217 RepID=A0A4R2IQP7_9ACTN|nr:hypothetical protein EV646_109270 [Kribbella antiqua]
MRWAGLVAVAMLLGACGNESGAGEDPTMSPTGSSSRPSASPGAGPVELAKADLVARLGVDAGQVTVVSSEEMTWSDGSLGCPEPGMSYTQALIDGYRVILEADGKRYHYHSGGSRPPFLCADPQGG